MSTDYVILFLSTVHLETKGNETALISCLNFCLPQDVGMTLPPDFSDRHDEDGMPQPSATISVSLASV
jgi:hypothetical protein